MNDQGAHFYRTDFQVHSPRDINWAGPNCVTDAERCTYAKTLVDSCRTKGLQAIAITDHHDMVFVEYVRKAAAEEVDNEGDALPDEDRLVVFPGMELTLGVPCQALLIFDADFPADLFSLVINALALETTASDAPKTAQTKRLDHVQSMLHLKSELDKHAYLRDRYIVLPNVTNEGKFSILREGFPAKYIEMPCVGGYIDGEVTKLKPGNKSKVDGKDKAWGHKRIACFQTSDNRAANHNELGVASSWVKWAIPTAEALRQACLAQESRVLHEPPKMPAVVVRSINVNNSAFLGPVDLAFNPQYNTLIGGRGTGKSSILEYLRWALCDQPPAVAGEDAPNYQDRRSRLIGATLKPINAVVEVRFEIHGVPHLVRRRSADGSISIKIDGGELRPCSEEEIRTLLPIQAYSQKQLSSVSVRVDELLRFVTSPIRVELSRIDARLEEQAAQIRQSFATRSRKKALEQVIVSRELEETSLTGQADSIRTSLSGLSDADRALLDRGRVYDAAERTIHHWRDNTSLIAGGVASLTQQVSGLLLTPDAAPEEPEVGLLSAAKAEYDLFLKETNEALQLLTTKAKALTKPYDELPTENPWRLWSDRRAAFKVQYDDAVQRSSAQSQQMNELQRVETLLGEHVRETARLRSELTGVTGADERYEVARREWLTLLKQRDDQLEAQCKKLTTGSGGAIRAQVRRLADTKPFEEAVKQSLAGAKITGGKIETLAESIANSADPMTTWSAILKDLELLADFDPEKQGTDKRPETANLAPGGFTAGELDRTSRFLKPEQWLNISLSAIKSKPIFEHRSREAEYIPFQDASAGQQATALLKVLLSEAGPPLIIDQPEEDLDNPVMLEIVSQVWEAKQRRQIIFASHNANLVVNGDAELVVWCEHRTFSEQSRGYIAGQGAIDIPVAREAIKKIMEGGEAAFNLRKEKYGF